MPVLYKYLPPERVDVLTHGRIRFSPPRDLNDPFESRPRVVGSRASSERRLRALFSDPDLIAKKVAEFDAVASKHGGLLIWREVNRLFGVLSLTSNPVNPVMWAHYAQSYRGSLIGFDAEHEWLAGRSGEDDVTKRVRQVAYSHDRPQVVAGDPGDVDIEQFIVGCIITKHAAWAFEEEWRILRNAVEALPASQCQGVTNLFSVPRDALTHVILGPRMTPAAEAQIRSVLASGRYPRAQLKQLVLTDEAFDLVIEDASATPMDYTA